MSKLHPAALAAALCALLAAPVLAKGAGNAKCPKPQQQISATQEGVQHVSADEHVAKHFTPKGSYLLSDANYQRFAKGKAKLGRDSGGDTFLFVAGGKFIDGVIAAAKKADGTIDFAVVDKKLGFDPGTFPPAGGLWRVDINVKNSCYRLAKADDPGANAHFKPGGFTSGGVPEVLVLNGHASHAEQIVKPGPQKAKAPKANGDKPGKPGAGQGKNGRKK